METTIATLKENAPFAVMLLLAVIYLDRGQNELRVEMNRGFGELRDEMYQENTAIRQDLTTGHASIRQDMSTGHTSLRQGISDLGERMARVETKVDNIDQRMIRFEGILDGQRPSATK